MHEDEELLERAVGGDEAALGALLEARAADLARRIEARIPRRWRSLLGAEDVLQQTFVDAFRGIGEFENRGPDSFAAWLWLVTQRNLTEAVRSLSASKRGGRLMRREPPSSAATRRAA